MQGYRVVGIGQSGFAELFGYLAFRISQDDTGLMSFFELVIIFTLFS
jgi:hypothetical protein